MNANKARIYMELITVSAATMAALMVFYIRRSDVLYIISCISNTFSDELSIRIVTCIFLSILSIIIFSIATKFNGFYKFNDNFSTTILTQSLCVFLIPIAVAVLAGYTRELLVSDSILTYRMSFELLLSIVAVIVCAILEEYIFRVWLLRALGKISSWKIAPAIISSLVFSAVHTKINPTAYGIIFVVGMLWAWSSQKLSGIVLASASHASYNVIVDVIVPIINIIDINQQKSYTAILVMTVGVFTLLTVTIISTVFICHRRYYDNNGIVSNNRNGK